MLLKEENSQFKRKKKQQQTKICQINLCSSHEITMQSPSIEFVFTVFDLNENPHISANATKDAKRLKSYRYVDLYIQKTNLHRRKETIAVCQWLMCLACISVRRTHNVFARWVWLKASERERARERETGGNVSEMCDERANTNGQYKHLKEKHKRYRHTTSQREFSCKIKFDTEYASGREESMKWKINSKNNNNKKNRHKMIKLNLDYYCLS